MYSTRTAYLFWFASLFGVAGLHRLYLGKVGTGLLYFFTGGLFALGTIYDGLTMQSQVREANHWQIANKSPPAVRLAAHTCL